MSGKRTKQLVRFAWYLQGEGYKHITYKTLKKAYNDNPTDKAIILKDLKRWENLKKTEKPSKIN